MSFWDGAAWRPERLNPQAKVPPQRRLRDWIATAVMLLGLAAIIVPNQRSEASGAAITLAPPMGRVGDALVITGANFPPGGAVTVRFDGTVLPVRPVKVDRRGGFVISTSVPPATPGTHMLDATAIIQATGKAAKSASGAIGAQAAAQSAFTLLATEAATPMPTTAPSSTTPSPSPSASATPSPTASPTPVATPTAAPITPAPTQAPSATAAPVAASRVLLGLGTQAEGARRSRLTAEAPIGMLSNWYNGPSDLGWMTDGWHRSIYRSAYDAGYAMHLITWTNDPETALTTAYGAACGRAYPLSSRFVDDMRALAAALGGTSADPPLYVTLNTEFQTYPCRDNAWSASAETTAYYRGMKDNYLAAMRAMKAAAPNVRVSIGWGGWQARFDDPSIGSGRSMIPYFADVMQASDFVSFQLMSGDSNASDALAMTRLLGAYRPVLQAHHMPDADRNALSTVCATWNADMLSVFTDDVMGQLTRSGLFAWAVMHDGCAVASETQFVAMRDLLRRYGR